MCMGYVLRVSLYGFLPLSLLAPLSALTVIFSVILEHVILKEELQKITIICLIFIFIGVILCVLTGNIIDESYTLEALQNLFLEENNFILTISLFAIILCCREFLRHTSFFYNKIDDIPIAQNSGIDSEDENVNFDVNNDTKLDDDYDNIDDNFANNNNNVNINSNNNKYYNSSNNNNNNNNNNKNEEYTGNNIDNNDANAISYYYNYNTKGKDGQFSTYFGLFYLIFSSAVFTGFLSVSAKAMIEIVKCIFLYGIKEDIFLKPGIYIIFLLLPICSFIKQKYTWYALSLYSPLQYIPFYQAASILANSLFGLIYFQVNK